MFDRNGKKVHQNPPRVFGPGSTLQECVDYQERFIEELLTVLVDVVPETKKDTVKELKDSYELGLSELKHHHAIQVLNGQGDHSALEHYLVRFQSKEPPENQPYPFPNPGTSLFRPLLELLGNYAQKYHRELRLRGADRTRLEEGWTLLDTPSELYYDEEGNPAMVLNTEEAVSFWHFGNEEAVLMKHWPAQTFFTRTNMELMIKEFFAVMAKHSIDIGGDAPLTEKDICHTLSCHLPRQFHDPHDRSHQQPRELQLLVVKPMADIEREFERMGDYEVGLRVTHGADHHQLDHLMAFKIPQDGLIIYHPVDGVSFWHYSTQEGIWVFVPDYLPYVPQAKFQAGMDAFFAQHNYRPLAAVPLDTVHDLGQEMVAENQIRDLPFDQLETCEETGFFRIIVNGDTEHIVYHEYHEVQHNHTVILVGTQCPHQEVDLHNCPNGDCYQWDELNPTHQHRLYQAMSALHGVGV